MKTLHRDELLSWWLKRYHDTTIEEVKQRYKEQVPYYWWNEYKVTQEQHDEFEAHVRAELKRIGHSKAKIRREIGWIMLDCGPAVKE